MQYLDIVKEQAAALEAGKDFATVTIAQADGSAPRSNGKMLVYPDGSTYGTVGGGTLELLAIRDAKKCLEKKENALLQYDLDVPSAKAGMICGGKVSLLFEVYIARPLLVLCGAGHVGEGVLTLAKYLGYETWLLDDRPEEAIASKIALCDRFIPVKDFQTELLGMQIPAGAYAVIATHGHAMDGEALFGMLHHDNAYVGMIGSRKKIAALFAKLEDRGITKEQLSTVYTPIGLNIGGETPQEIALAIMGEIQSVRYGKEYTHSREAKA